MADEQDPIADVLKAVPTSDRVRAAAWDAFHDSKDRDDLAARLKDIALPNEVKAALWDAKPEMTFSKVNDEPVSALDSLGTFAKHVGAQIDPLAAAGAIGQAVLHPIDTVKGIGAAQGALFDKAKAAYEAGDNLTAARHFVDYLLPLIGPVIDKSADSMQKGDLAAGAGDAVGLGLGMFGPGALPKGAAAVRAGSKLNPAEAAANAFAESHGVPLDAATATGSRWARSAQKRVANSMGGEGTAERLIQGQKAALQRVGGELADAARPGAPVTPEQAGAGVRSGLTAKAGRHLAEANTEYERLREMEQQPGNKVAVPLAPKSVDGLLDWQAAQLRRIVHELDASGYVKRTINHDTRGIGGNAEVVQGSGGAKVFDDIKAEMSAGANPTRGVVQDQLENYLGGGPVTPVVKAALEVAKKRFLGRDHTISTPELPPSAMHEPTRLESARVTSEDMGFPVDTTAAKAALRPVFDQMMRQMPLTQRQASPGLQAIQNILEGPDTAPLTQVDRDLSAIKKLSREQGGLAKLGVKYLEAAVQEAAGYGGKEVVDTLDRGRLATIRKVQTEALEQVLRGGPMAEPVAVYKQLIAPGDSAIELLRKVKENTPAEVPKIARAHLEQLLEKAGAEGGFGHADKLWADWQRMGQGTKAILYPNPGQVKSLDNFFLLAKRIGENPNPSGTAHTLTALNFGSVPVTFALSKLLYTPRGVQALTRLMRVSGPSARTSATVVRGGARATAIADVMQAAREAGVAMPKAAQSDPASAQK